MRLRTHASNNSGTAISAPDGHQVLKACVKNLNGPGGVGRFGETGKSQSHSAPGKALNTKPITHTWIAARKTLTELQGTVMPRAFPMEWSAYPGPPAAMDR